MSMCLHPRVSHKNESLSRTAYLPFKKKKNYGYKAALNDPFGFSFFFFFFVSLIVQVEYPLSEI